MFTIFVCLVSLLQLLSSLLVQNGDDDEGIMGFLPNDILTEVNRAKKMVKMNEIFVSINLRLISFDLYHQQNCCYCKKRGANIGCCHKTCRRAFHLPCALKNNTLFEFCETYRSFCNKHHNINRPRHTLHKSDDNCVICLDKMGEYRPTKSISSPCCNKSSWYHKRCIQEMAYSSGYFFKCPLCNNSGKFRRRLCYQGVFIPDR